MYKRAEEKTTRSMGPKNLGVKYNNNIMSWSLTPGICSILSVLEGIEEQI